MKELYRSRIKKAIALILPIVLFWVAAENVLFKHYDENTDRLQRFYNEPANSLDVVFLGASEIFTGFAPGYAYDQYGFTSYPYAMDANTGSLYEAQLKEILSHQQPQVLIVDVYGFIKGDNSVLIDDARMRLFAESIPRTGNWLELVMNYPSEDRISFFFPFLKNHAHLWLIRDSMTKMRTDPSFWDRESPSRLKGMMTLSSVYQTFDDGDTMEHAENYQLHEDAVPYLIDFLECCQEQQLEDIIFVNFPRAISGEEAYRLLSNVNAAEKIVNGYGYQLINFHDIKDEIGIDDNADFYNSHHLNVYGQTKMTSYLGRMLTETYHLVPREQNPENIERWEESAACTQLFFDMVKQAMETGTEIWFSESCEQWNAWERNKVMEHH